MAVVEGAGADMGGPREVGTGQTEGAGGMEVPGVGAMVPLPSSRATLQHSKVGQPDLACAVWLAAA